MIKILILPSFKIYYHINDSFIPLHSASLRAYQVIRQNTKRGSCLTIIRQNTLLEKTKQKRGSTYLATDTPSMFHVGYFRNKFFYASRPKLPLIYQPHGHLMNINDRCLCQVPLVSPHPVRGR